MKDEAPVEREKGVWGMPWGTGPPGVKDGAVCIMGRDGVEGIEEIDDDVGWWPFIREGGRLGGVGAALAPPLPERLGEGEG